MPSNSDIEAARSLIGTGEPTDYVLAPKDHAEIYRTSAPKLAEILDSSPCQATAAEFERRDGEAGEAQGVFLEKTSKANAAMLISACGSGILAASAGLVVLIQEPYLRIGQVIVAGSCLVAAGLARKWLHQIGRGNLLTKWMRRRAKAETQRLRYFELLTSSGDAAVARSTMLLRLEYFRRYQLDVQLSYYGSRGSDHSRDADSFLDMESNAVALGMVGVGGAALLTAAFGPAWSGLAALGVIGTAYATFSGSKEALRQSRRNAERYDRTAEVLRELEAKLDAVRGAVAGGDDDALAAFVESVHEQLSLEHRQWIVEEEGRSAALQRLDKQLHNTQAALEKVPK